MTAYLNKMAVGTICPAELAQGLACLGYRVQRPHANGRFEIAGVPCAVITPTEPETCRSQSHWVRLKQAAQEPVCSAGFGTRVQ